jgi:HAD superfamily hydrolase (TIGR01484 family)
MHYIALATDYDGTIAHDGGLDDPTIAALERLRAGARKIILVTGRELPDLQRVCDRLDLFDLIVAENGALLYNPATREETPLCDPPDERFIARLRAAEVAPLSVGRGIVATWEPNETVVLEAIRDLGLELKITFNKGAVMVLPGDVTKASGLRRALEALDFSPLNVVGVGDAENDMAMLDFCGFSVAVANALPTVKERATLVTEGARGAGVAELVDRILATDLRDLDGAAPRQRLELAKPDGGGNPITYRPRRQSLLLTGHSGGGKSTLTLGILERLHAGGFQACVIDPEGDYEDTAGMVQEGTADSAPDAGQLLELLQKTGNGVVVNLLAVKLADRPGFLADLLPQLMAMRARSGRPHVVVVDEAHHMLPAEWDPGAAAIPPELHGFLFITMRPQLLSRRVLDSVDSLLVVGAEPEASIQAFCEARGLPVPGEIPPIETGQALLLRVAEPGIMRRVEVIPGVGIRRRHLRKYAEGKLAEESVFYFRGPEGKLKLRAHNLVLFVQMGDGVDEETWEFHRRNGDYSDWMLSCVKDEELSEEVAAIETGDLPFEEARNAVREAIERRYTAPG